MFDTLNFCCTNVVNSQHLTKTKHWEIKRIFRGTGAGGPSGFKPDDLAAPRLIRAARPVNAPLKLVENADDNTASVCGKARCRVDSLTRTRMCWSRKQWHGQLKVQGSACSASSRGIPYRIKSMTSYGWEHHHFTLWGTAHEQPPVKTNEGLALHKWSIPVGRQTYCRRSLMSLLDCSKSTASTTPVCPN